MFPLNNENDLILMHVDQQGLEDSIKAIGTKRLVAYTPVFREPVTVPYHNDKGELVSQDTVMMYCQQFKDKGAQ
jgi:hypothetical protein